MTFIKQFLAIFLCTALMQGCGFQRLHSDNAAEQKLLQDVAIANINSRNGQYLRNALAERFYHYGTPKQTRFVLTIGLEEQTRNLDIQSDDTTTRKQIITLANYQLKDRWSNQVVSENIVRATASYNILANQYTTSITKQDALERSLESIADKIRQQIMIFLAQSKLRLESNRN